MSVPAATLDPGVTETAAPRRGGGERRDVCHLGHPIETRVYGGKPKRRCWTCNANYQRGVYRPRASSRRHRLRVYGLTPEDYDALLAKQDRACAICREPCRTGDALVVDHDHDTGAVRGLLCRTCNLALGYLRDDPDLIAAAAAYLAG